MSLSQIKIRPLSVDDIDSLDRWRRLYRDAFLELPKGFSGVGVETAVAEKGGKLTSSLTGVHAVVCDPFIHDPAASGPDIFASVLMLERVLTYAAQTGGAVDSYIAVPKQLTEYIEIIKRCGYVLTCENCVILRRPLQPDSIPLLEDEEKAKEVK